MALRRFWVWFTVDNRPERVKLGESVQISAAIAVRYLFPPILFKDPVTIIIGFLISAIYILGMNYQINQIRKLSHD